MIRGTYRAVSLTAALLAAAPAVAQTGLADAVSPDSVPVAASTVAPADADADVAPTPPAGAAISFVPPAHDATGYRTPNRALTPGEATWHLRVALNVAALGCRGPEEAATAAAYNALLKANEATLAAEIGRAHV